MVPISAGVITVSDRSAAGVRPDQSGPVAVEALRAAGFACDDATVVPDGAAAVETALRAALAQGIRVIVTTGGTGVAPRDQTPEATLRVIERTLPGISEELRRNGRSETPTASLTRGLAGVAGRALIVNLAGSPRAVVSGMPVILSVVSHVLSQLDGGDH
ncbi:MAG TPA: MogA/MoaB family molybdenum cofactor biosynthesis protein [Candidatus Lumbricidophila sp.]|nr:MogA/MoaB family molybdenum cofactor biosynthesis protein [Candidatus Lumbricidophila sp.]